MNEFKLIEGVFTPEEAKDVLLNLIEYKIEFHNRKNFSSEIKNGTKDEQSLKRLMDLKETKLKIRELIESPNKKNVRLSVTSLITIKTIL